MEGLYTGLVVCWALVVGGGTLYWSCSVLGFGDGWRDFILVLIVYSVLIMSVVT